MREIKFRGKTTLSEKWVFGSLVIAETNFFIVISKMIKNWVTDYSHETVTSETVGQYTGLKDKNGIKEIYEGDIVKWHGFGSHPLMIVVFRSGQFMLEFVSKSFTTPSRDWPFHDKYQIVELDRWDHEEEGVEIIGNIHENPELLENDETV